MSTRRILSIHVNSAQGLPSKALGAKPSAHVALTVDGRTRESVVIKNDCHPSWHNVLEFDFEPKEPVGTMSIQIDVIDNGLLGKTKIGNASLPLTEYVDGEEHAISVPLTDKKDKPVGELSISVTLNEPAKPSKH